LLHIPYVLENEPFNAEFGPHSRKWPLLEAQQLFICFTIVIFSKQLHGPSEDLIFEKTYKSKPNEKATSAGVPPYSRKSSSTLFFYIKELLVN